MTAIQTVPPNDRRERFTALAGQTVFPFDFPIFDQGDLDVRRYRAGVETVLAVGGDFAVAGVGEQAGGAITLATPAEAGDLVVIRSAQAIGRAAIFANGGDLRAEALLAEFNRTHIALQQLALALQQALRLPPSDPADAAELPGPNARPNTVMGFGAAGELLLRPISLFSGGGFQQTGAGAVARLVADELALRIHPRQFGGAGDGATDDTLAVQRCFDQAAARGAYADLDDGEWRISSTVYLTGAARGLRMQGRIVYAGAPGTAALVLGDGGGTPNQAKRYEGIRVVRATQSDWSSEADIGVVLRNFDACFAQVLQAEGFTIGVRAVGETRGFEDSTVELGRIANNKIGVDVRGESAGSWNNSVRWIGGHIANASATNPTLDRFGVRFSKGAGGYNLHNAHVFVGTGFELQNQGGAVQAIPFLVEVNARGITGEALRIEGNSPTVARHTAAAQDCVYKVAFSSNGAITGTEGNAYLLAVDYPAGASRAGAIVLPYHQAAAAQHTPRLVAGVPSLRAAAFRWASGLTGFEGLALVDASPAGPPSSLAALALPGLNGITWTPDWVNIPNGHGIGFVVDCTNCKDFMLAQEGTLLRAFVMQLDASDVVLGSGAVALMSNQSLAWNAAMQCWIGAADMEDATYTRLQRITVAASARKAIIGVRGSSDSMTLASLRLFCPAIHSPAVYAGGGRKWGTRELWAEASWDPPSIAAGASAFTDVALPDAEPGDFVEASFSRASTLPLEADMPSSGNVRVRFTNNTAAPVDIAAGTVFVRALKPRLV